MYEALYIPPFLVLATDVGLGFKNPMALQNAAVSPGNNLGSEGALAVPRFFLEMRELLH
jgi:hypothetical protein